MAGVSVSKTKVRLGRDRAIIEQQEKSVKPEPFKQNRGKGVESQILIKEVYHQLIKVWQDIRK